MRPRLGRQRDHAEAIRCRGSTIGFRSMCRLSVPCSSTRKHKCSSPIVSAPVSFKLTSTNLWSAATAVVRACGANCVLESCLRVLNPTIRMIEHVRADLLEDRNRLPFHEPFRPGPLAQVLVERGIHAGHGPHERGSRLVVSPRHAQGPRATRRQSVASRGSRCCGHSSIVPSLWAKPRTHALAGSVKPTGGLTLHVSCDRVHPCERSERALARFTVDDLVIA